MAGLKIQKAKLSKVTAIMPFPWGESPPMGFAIQMMAASRTVMMIPAFFKSNAGACGADCAAAALAG